jgi:hypothetical protein
VKPLRAENIGATAHYLLVHRYLFYAERFRYGGGFAATLKRSRRGW